METVLRVAQLRKKTMGILQNNFFKVYYIKMKRMTKAGVSSFPPSSYRYRLLQTDKIAIKLNAELARSFSKTRVWNHKKFQNVCVESSKVCVRNNQDNFFLINVACRSNANMIKWLRAAIFSNFEL